MILTPDFSLFALIFGGRGTVFLVGRRQQTAAAMRSEFQDDPSVFILILLSSGYVFALAGVYTPINYRACHNLTHWIKFSNMSRAFRGRGLRLRGVLDLPGRKLWPLNRNAAPFNPSRWSRVVNG